MRFVYFWFYFTIFGNGFQSLTNYFSKCPRVPACQGHSDYILLCYIIKRAYFDCTPQQFYDLSQQFGLFPQLSALCITFRMSSSSLLFVIETCVPWSACEVHRQLTRLQLDFTFKVCKYRIHLLHLYYLYCITKRQTNYCHQMRF